MFYYNYYINRCDRTSTCNILLYYINRCDRTSTCNVLLYYINRCDRTSTCNILLYYINRCDRTSTCNVLLYYINRCDRTSTCKCSTVLPENVHFFHCILLTLSCKRCNASTSISTSFSPVFRTSSISNTLITRSAPLIRKLLPRRANSIDFIVTAVAPPVNTRNVLRILKLLTSITIT